MAARRETWRTIPSCPAYEASDQGRIRRAAAGQGAVSGKILARAIGSAGYPLVNVRGRARTVHRLVAEAFLGPLPRHSHVHHRNRDRTDARLKNLLVCPRGHRDHGLLHRRASHLRAHGEPNPIVSCACGCGRRFRRYRRDRVPRAYARGHNSLHAAARAAA